MGGQEVLLTSGVAGVLALVIIYLLVANRLDRAHYRKLVAAADRRYDDEVEAHKQTQRDLDGERKERRKAEDAADRATRAVERTNEELVELRQQIVELKAEVKRLGGGLP